MSSNFISIFNFLLFRRRHRGLIFLETYTAKEVALSDLPPFLKVVKEVTGDPCYSMFNLSKKDMPAPLINGKINGQANHQSYHPVSTG